MSAGAETGTGGGPSQVRETAIYVYGITPAGVEPTGQALGVGDPPTSVEVIERSDIAALISEIDVGARLGTPQDMSAHARLLDATAATMPVLPLRFGALVADRRMVEEELLAAHHDEFAQALRQLEGRMQFIVKGRYDESAVIREVIDENAQARHSREAVADKPAEAVHTQRVRLGQIVAKAVVGKRVHDTRGLVRALRPLEGIAVVREATHDLDAVYVAYFVHAEKVDEFREAVDAWATRQRGRIDVRLLGPMAPYDFVVSRKLGA